MTALLLFVSDDTRMARQRPRRGGALSVVKRPYNRGIPNSELKAGAIVDRFQIVEPLGRGGFGEVWKARDLRLDRLVAIKRLADDLAADASFRERLRREALAASALVHPNICTVYDLASIDGQHLLVMEYVQGDTIHDLIRGGALPPDKAVDIATQIAAGLDEAHRSGIVHRDVKGGNVMLTPSGQVKVLDFGLAKRVVSAAEELDSPTEVRLTREGAAVGTLHYMSPEQLLGQPVDRRTDVFSLGVLLFEMLTGKLPFAGTSAAAVSDAILHQNPGPEIDAASIPRSLRDVVLKALAKERENRYATAADFAAALRPATVRRRLNRPVVFVAAGALLVLIAISAFEANDRSKRAERERWARQTAIPQIEALLAADDNVGAFRLVEQAAAILPNDPTLARLHGESSAEVTIDSTPRGAEVFYGRNSESDDRLQLLGHTPLERVRIPAGFFHRFRFVKSGHAPATRFFPNFGGKVLNVPLPTLRDVPPGMVHVPADAVAPSIPGLDHLPPVDIPSFFIDEYEVTNEQYKRFVDAGGYQKREYWKIPFVKGGRPVEWETAMRELVDATGEPGPATWDLGSYPKGKGSYPVGGVSWYEAAAFAEFSGKRLPSIYHWSQAAVTTASSVIAPLSNFGGDGPLPAGTRRGGGGHGAYDMAGNLKEWCSNEGDPGKRFILGGAWNEPDYMFIDQDAQQAWLRSPNFGFRCMRSAAPVPGAADRRVVANVREFSKENPVSDELFRAYTGAYHYDKTPLQAKVVARDDSAEEWTVEKVGMRAAYGGEQLVVYVFLPKNARPPMQPVIYFPGSNAIRTDRLTSLIPYADMIPRSGRALVIPIYKGTYERRDEFKSDYPKATSFYRDHVIAWAKDLRRSVDYLETRRDMDMQKLSFVGLSWGGAMGPLMMAMEPRIKVAVLLSGGLNFQDAAPEVDVFNFLPRATQPTLMLNARYDHFFPVETSQLPMLRLLGAPEEHKRHVIYDSGHAIPRNESVRETVAWLNRYLGAPER